MRSQPIVLTLGVSVCFCLIGGEVEAARFLTAEVRQEGSIILRATFSMPDSASEAACWNQLDRQVFQEVLGSITTLEKVRPTLTGNLRLTIMHVEHQLLSVSLSQLDMRRVPGTIDQWKLPRSEVERTAIMGGIDLPSELSWVTLLLTLFGFVGALGGGWMIWNRRDQFAEDPDELDE